MVGKRYELYDLGDVAIEEALGTMKGKGMLIFLPERFRRKKKIGEGTL